MSKNNSFQSLGIQHGRRVITPIHIRIPHPTNRSTLPCNLSKYLAVIDLFVGLSWSTFCSSRSYNFSYLKKERATEVHQVYSIPLIRSPLTGYNSNSKVTSLQLALIAQLVEQRSAIARSWIRVPIKPGIFPGFLRSCLSCRLTAMTFDSHVVLGNMRVCKLNEWYLPRKLHSPESVFQGGPASDRIGIWRCWFFRRGKKRRTRRKTSQSRLKTQQQS